MTTLKSDDAVQDGTVEAYMDAAAAFQGLTILSEWRFGVRDHLKTITAAAQLVFEFSLDDEAEAAPIYRP